MLSGLAFFILGSSYWGMLYALAVLFFVLPYLMWLEPYWAVLEYGVQAGLMVPWVTGRTTLNQRSPRR